MACMRDLTIRRRWGNNIDTTSPLFTWANKTRGAWEWLTLCSSSTCTPFPPASVIGDAKERHDLCVRIQRACGNPSPDDACTYPH